MEMVVHKTVEECDDSGNSCQDKEIQVMAMFLLKKNFTCNTKACFSLFAVQVINERPVHRCKVQIIPASACKAEHPKVVCERCTSSDTLDDNEVCVSVDDFEPDTSLDISATCLW